VQGFSLDNSVGLICGGGAALVALMTVLTFVSLLGARSADVATERAAALAIAIVALIISLISFWSTGGGLAAMDGPAKQFSVLITRFLGSFGIPVALFQIQATVAALIIAVLAWRYPHR
jgi:hypothetical protein